MYPFREIVDYGQRALLLQWRETIDPGISQSVHAYAKAAGEVMGVQETVPAYCSLLVTFDPKQTNPYQLREQLYALKPLAKHIKSRLHKLPVCYGSEFGPDLVSVAEKLGLNTSKVIELHQQVEYRVFQLGYQPGFAFLGLTDPALAIGRLTEPRARVPAGSVGLAGSQTGVYPTEAPGGWQLIGRCPWPLLRAEPEPVSRLRVGDRVCFFAIEAGAWNDYAENPQPWID